MRQCLCVLCGSALRFSTIVTSSPVPLAESWEVSGRRWDSRIPLLDYLLWGPGTVRVFEPQSLLLCPQPLA